ncbi:hypothetical protein ACFXPN_18185 [Streptomyces griseorubiginosus]|uniref:hypothetical protein n=1 Tax=Streptomyces griseorubiginosus TaxID=67304 RepID=UPI0036BD01AB
MSARERGESYPSVSTDGVSGAAVLRAGHKRLALLVVDRDGQPYAIMSGSRLIGRLLPECRLQDDRLPCRRFRRPTAGPDTSVMHITALKPRTHTPPVAVVERDGDRPRFAGAVPAARLTQRLVGGT